MIMIHTRSFQSIPRFNFKPSLGYARDGFSFMTKMLTSLQQSTFLMEDQYKYVDIGNCRTDEQRKWYESIAKRGIDPFDPEHFHSVHSEFGGEIIEVQNDSWMLGKNAVQYKGPIKYQFLIVPRFFATTLIEVFPKAWTDLRDLILWLQKEYGFNGHFLYSRMGSTHQTGASVVRLHFNIIVPDCPNEERVSIFPETIRVRNKKPNS